MKTLLLRTPVFLIVCTMGAGLLFAGGAKMTLPKNMQDFKHVNTLIIPDKNNSIFGIHHFYMNSEGLERFRNQAEGEPYPEGTKIVGKVYDVLSREGGGYKEGDLLAYTYMQKAPGMEKTKNTGGWLFVKFDAKGDAASINPATDCFVCHAPAKASDFVLSEPLM
jgi:hypothetical protein